MGAQSVSRPNPSVAAYVRSVLKYRGASAAAVSAVAVASVLSMPALADTTPSDNAAAASADNSGSSPSNDLVLNEVVVTGQRAALESAQHLKEVSPEIVDSIIAQDIGKL